MIALAIAAYAFIGLFMAHQFKTLIRKYRPEIRPCFGRRKIYLRCRKSGRLMECSLNPFTLLILAFD